MDAAAFVREHGQPFRPVPLLKGIRRRKPGNCYAVAGGLALDGRGFYVEGFAHHPGDPAPIRHAWITTDETDAIDPSCEYALECSYYGVPFSLRALSRLLMARGYHGQFDPVDEVVREALTADPAVFPAATL